MCRADNNMRAWHVRAGHEYAYWYSMRSDQRRFTCDELSGIEVVHPNMVGQCWPEDSDGDKKLSILYELAFAQADRQELEMLLNNKKAVATLHDVGVDALGPVEIIGGAVISTLAFTLTFWSTSCMIRATSPAVASMVVGALAVMAALANYIGIDALLNQNTPSTNCQWMLPFAMCHRMSQAYQPEFAGGCFHIGRMCVRYRMQRTCRTWLVLALCLWAGLFVGVVLGNAYWWIGVAKVQEYHKMASYEWIATTGVPAKFPLFFEWSLDPLMLEDKLKSISLSKRFVHQMEAGVCPMDFRLSTTSGAGFRGTSP
eukprot:Skav219790  [mRNA]  locus=scaffold3701:120350:128879:+ [translate_table: standard]